MAGNTRGKIKECLEGVHNNFGWSQRHLEKALVLIQEHKPELSSALEGLYDTIQSLDELAQGIYAKI